MIYSSIRLVKFPAFSFCHLLVHQNAGLLLFDKVCVLFSTAWSLEFLSDVQLLQRNFSKWKLTINSFWEINIEKNERKYFSRSLTPVGIWKKFRQGTIADISTQLWTLFTKTLWQLRFKKFAWGCWNIIFLHPKVQILLLIVVFLFSYSRKSTL